MARIREYTNEIQGLRVSSQGARAIAGLGEFQAAAYRQIGDSFGSALGRLGGAIQGLYDNSNRAATNKEQAAGMQSLAMLETELEGDLQNRLKAGDPSMAGTIRDQWWSEVYEPKMQEWAGSFETEGGQNWANKQYASNWQSTFRTSTADAAALEGLGLVEKLNGGVNEMVSSVYKSPDKLEIYLNRIEETIAPILLNSSLDAVKAEKSRQEITEQARTALIKSAIAGEINLSPELFLERKAAGDYEPFSAELGMESIGGIDMPSLEAYQRRAEALIEARATEKRAVENQEYTERTRASNERKGQLVYGAFDPVTRTFGVGAGQFEAIMNDQSLTKEDRGQLIEKLVGLIGKKDVPDSPGIVNEFATRIANGEDVGTIRDEMIRMVGADGERRLSTTSYNFLNGLLDKPGTEKDYISNLYTAETKRAIQAVNPQTAGLTGSFSSRGFGGDTAEAEMMVDISRRMALAEAAAPGSSVSLLTPGDPNYIFKPEYLEQWQKRAIDLGSEVPLPGGTTGGGVLENYVPGPNGTVTPPTPEQRRPLEEIFNPTSAPAGEGGATLQNINYVPAPVEFDMSPELQAAITAPSGGRMELEPPGSEQTGPTSVTPEGAPTIYASTDTATRPVNAQGYGEKVTGSITLNGREYKWLSGGGGRGSLPFGAYKIGDYMTGEERRSVGYQYQRDAFMLSDARDTAPAVGGGTRTGLLIHNDGKDRSAGCINIIGDDATFAQFTADLKVELANNGGSMYLQVGPKGYKAPAPGTIAGYQGQIYKGAAKAPKENGIVVQAQGTTAQTRKLDVSSELSAVLTASASASGTSAVIFSGGQAGKGSGGPRTGSTRHDHGYAADLWLYQNGKLLDFSNADDLPHIKKFIQAAVAAGATGIGAGPGYMGAGIHVGFGSKGARGGPVVAWGAGGKSANAPAWLRDAVSSTTMVAGL